MNKPTRLLLLFVMVHIVSVALGALMGWYWHAPPRPIVIVSERVDFHELPATHAPPIHTWEIDWERQ